MPEDAVDGIHSPSGSDTPSQSRSQSLAVPTSESALQKWKIAALEEKLQLLESGQAVKQKETHYYVSKGRALRRIVTLYDSIEDLIAENDRQCDSDQPDEDVTLHEQRLQIGYIALNNALPWFHRRASDLEYDKYVQMLKKLKILVAKWINCKFKPSDLVDPDSKDCRGFINDACGRLLCPTELNWTDPVVKAGIQDRADGFVVTEMSWPTFLYEKYTADQDNLEEGLFKSAILVQAFKAIFTSPSSAKDVGDDGNGANIIANNRCAKRDLFSGKKVKMHVAQIINMHTVTPRSIAYVACQLRFALSSVTTWRSIDGDFDYVPFWHSIVDFFERPPGRLARQKTERLLAWWTRKVFGKSHRAELSDGAKAKMSVNTLVRQCAQLDDMLFDSE